MRAAKDDESMGGGSADETAASAKSDKGNDTGCSSDGSINSMPEVFCDSCLDGSKSGKADPAFDAHELVIVYWAQAVWYQWFGQIFLEKDGRRARRS